LIDAFSFDSSKFSQISFKMSYVSFRADLALISILTSSLATFIIVISFFKLSSLLSRINTFCSSFIAEGYAGLKPGIKSVIVPVAAFMNKFCSSSF